MRKATFVFCAGLSVLVSGLQLQAQSARSNREVPRFEIGGQFTSLWVNPHSPSCFDLCVIGFDRSYTEPGGGARFTYNPTNHIGIEAEFNAFPREHRESTFFGLSGRNFQTQFGVKAGKHFKKFGLFGKFRPGFVGFSKVSHLVSTSTIDFGGRQFTIGQFEEKSARFFSTDMGGVVEFYPSRQLVTRVDLGDTVIRYGDILVPGISLSGAIRRVPAKTRHNFQIAVGLGVRFK